ncbi:hypothetical protein ES706_00831 [subsurface metagenome]|nr:hypothetical protein [Hadesarchaea archaeon]
MAKRLRYRKYASIVICLLLVGMLSSICLSNIPLVKASPGAIIYAGCRESTYGIDPFPEPEEWAQDMKLMGGYWPGSQPAGVWIVGILAGEGDDFMLWTECNLQFPSPGGSYEHIIFDNTDLHEPYLDYFDTHGIKVWLQVEPGLADVPTLIDLVLDRYEHHDCVVGLGIDVEWHKQTEEDWGVPVTDALAENWEAEVKLHNEDYTLFLKHFWYTWMPPTYRGDIIFVNDSQGFGNLNGMVSEFDDWAARYYPNIVMYQYGYPADEKWWKRLSNPPKDIGDAIAAVVEQDMGLIWVDFTLRTVFPPLGSDNTPPVISNVASSSITYDSATITWDTDEPGDSVVNYGTTTALGSTESKVTMLTSHSITLTNLSASTTYYYEIQSTDASSNTAVDDNNGSYYTFTTAESDTTPPVIENVATSNITGYSATITWDTDELSDSVVRYGTTTPPGSTESDAAMVTAHSIILTNLSGSTTYYYEVQSTDASSNTAVDDNNGSYYTFTTTEADTTPPAAPTGLTATAVSHSRIDLDWNNNTENDLDHYHVYRSTTSGFNCDNSTFLDETTASDYPDTSVDDNTTYYYKVTAVDTSSNESDPSNEANATTPEAPSGPTMHVLAINMELLTLGQSYQGKAIVYIVDENDDPVPTATVYGHWEGIAPSGTQDKDTDGDGIAPFWSGKVRNPPSGSLFIFFVDNVAKDGWTYDPASNVETSDNIATP